MALNYTETITRRATTVVNDIEVASHIMTIATDNPGDTFVCNMHIRNNEAYGDKAVRDIVRANHAEFEDMAHELKAELLAKLESENK